MKLYRSLNDNEKIQLGDIYVERDNFSTADFNDLAFNADQFRHKWIRLVIRGNKIHSTLKQKHKNEQ